jgi:DNA-binding NtrC family response regulator
LKKKLIFLVENDPKMQAALVEFLEKDGYEVRAHFSVEDALMKLSNVQPAAAISDFNLEMYHMNGAQFLKEMEKKFPGIPVLLVSMSSFAAYAAEDNNLPFLFKHDDEGILAFLREKLG